MLVYASAKSTFERYGIFNHLLKGATIKGKNMLPIGSIFFSLKVAHMRIGDKLKGH